MTSKRKADLQRRLTLARVPTPPDGLAQRIKADIPNTLESGTRRDRERLSRSIVMNLRVAASIILLVGAAYVCLRLMAPAGMENQALMTPKAAAPLSTSATPAPAPQ